jgi:tetratricopeptide (TPR) repeat protein
MRSFSSSQLGRSRSNAGGSDFTQRNFSSARRTSGLDFNRGSAQRAFASNQPGGNRSFTSWTSGDRGSGGRSVNRADFASRNFRNGGNFDGAWRGQGAVGSDRRGGGPDRGGPDRGGRPGDSDFGRGGRGDSNRGDWNRGDGNRGDWNRGDWSRGDWNRGDWNRGNWNKGDWNKWGHNNWGRNGWNNWGKNHWNNNWWWGGHRGWYGYGRSFYRPFFYPWWGFGLGFGYPFLGWGLGWPYYYGNYGYGYSYPYYGNYGYDYGYGYPATTTYIYADADAAQPTVANQPVDDAAPATAPLDASSFISAGEDAFKAKRYEEAIRDWQHAMVDNPDNGAVVLLMGQALFALGQYDAAANTVQMGLQMLPEEEWNGVVKNYAQLYPDIQEYTNQIRAAEKARDADPQNGAIRFLLGYHFGYLNYPTQAVRELDKALDIEPRDVGAQKLRDLFAKQAGLPARQPAAPAAEPKPAAPLVPPQPAAPAAASGVDA